jgi:hypothetical protein
MSGIAMPGISMSPVFTVAGAGSCAWLCCVWQSDRSGPNPQESSHAAPNADTDNIKATIELASMLFNIWPVHREFHFRSSISILRQYLASLQPHKPHTS